MHKLHCDICDKVVEGVVATGMWHGMVGSTEKAEVQFEVRIAKGRDVCWPCLIAALKESNQVEEMAEAS